MSFNEHELNLVGLEIKYNPLYVTGKVLPVLFSFGC